MRIIERSAAILALFLAITGRAHAQDSTQVWSLGVDNQSGIYVGIALSPRFRLEPEVGLVRQHDTAVCTFDNAFGSTSAGALRAARASNPAARQVSASSPPRSPLCRPADC